MQISNTKIAGLVLLGLLLITGYSSMYILDKREKALVLQFGEVQKEVSEPGLKFKLPFIQKVLYFDNRLLPLDQIPKEFTLKEGQRLYVDSIAKYKIDSPTQFYKRVGTDLVLKQRLDSIVEDASRAVIGTN